MPRITLVGYRASGKTAVAASLATRLGCPWVDADETLERESATTIAEMIGTRGEAFFRDAEADLLRRLLASCDGVLATGGGVVLRSDNRHLLRAKGRPVIWLEAPAAVLRERLAGDPTTASRRPPLAGSDVLGEVADAVAARTPLYREVSDAVIDTASDAPDRLAERIADWLLHRQPASPHAGPERVP